MNPMAYGLKEVIGLKDVEDLLIGESQPLQTPEPIPFLEDYFRKNFNVTHVNFNNRNNVVSSLLVDSIHHKKYKKIARTSSYFSIIWAKEILNKSLI